jgi:hypothetical protein
MRTRLVVLVLVAAALTLPGPAVGRAKTCVVPRDAALVRVSPSVVLYRRPNIGQSTYRLVGCLRSTNRRRVVDAHLGVDHAAYGDSTTRRPLAIRTAGRFIAMLNVNEEPRYDNSNVGLQVTDLVSGRSLNLSVNNQRPAETVDGLLLSANGRVVVTVKDVAYAPSGVPESGLWTLQHGEFVLLERGSGPFNDTAFTKEGVRWASPTGLHTAPVASALG